MVRSGYPSGITFKKIKFGLSSAPDVKLMKYSFTKTVSCQLYFIQIPPRARKRSGMDDQLLLEWQFRLDESMVRLTAVPRIVTMNHQARPG